MRHLLIIITMALLLIAPAACGSTTPEAPSTATESPPPAESGPIPAQEVPGPEVPEPAGGEPKAERPAEVAAREDTAPMEASRPGDERATTALAPTTDKTDTWESPAALEGNRGTRHDRMEKSTSAMPGTPADHPEGSGHYGSREPREHSLKAGEVDDNDRWDEYLDFVQGYQGPEVHTTNLSNRRIITVLDQEGKPVPNAWVTISQGSEETEVVRSNRTYADGRTMFFPHEHNGETVMMGANRDREFTVTAKRDGFSTTIRVAGDTPREQHEITLEGRMHYGENTPLDVLFLLDSTGSMADEIHQIKTTLQSIAQKVSNLPANPDLRFGMVSYRDRGDEYITRIYDFDSKVQRFAKSIQGVQADGGDDYPESLNQALHEAVNDVSWREESIRLMFLVADAPPHLDYPQDEDYAVEMMRAREKGIKIFAVASSGLDQQGEYVFRQLAQQTMGRFIFILYGTGLQGSLETPHDVEQYSVDRLDSLIVGIIENELEALKSGSQDSMRMQ